MPLFVIIARDKPGTGALRQEIRPRHLDHLRAIDARMFAAGPMIDAAGTATGSLEIAEFDDLAATQAFADGDPFRTDGVFGEVTVTAWRKTLPEG